MSARMAAVSLYNYVTSVQKLEPLTPTESLSERDQMSVPEENLSAAPKSIR